MKIPDSAKSAVETRSLANLPELCTRAELAQFTGVSVQTLARWTVEGDKGPRLTKLGHAARYRKADVLAWLEASAA